MFSAKATLLTLLWIVCVATVPVPSHAPEPQHRNDLDQLESIWEEERYAEVYPRLFEYRKRPYGKSPRVDYMIATSLCRIEGKREIGAKYFTWMLYNYSLSGHGRELVEQEMQRCSRTSRPTQLSLVVLRTGGSPGIRGKMFYWDNPSMQLTSVSVEVANPIPYRELIARLHDDSATGAAEVQRLLSNSLPRPFVVEGRGHFILASSTEHSRATLRQIVGSLEIFLRHFESEFRIPVPPHAITIYMVPSSSELLEIAEKLHGIRIPPWSLGYSYGDDLSMAAFVTGDGWGTLGHELFHLMVRQDFGDVPPWIDEGVAALYEVAAIDGARVFGIPNWRGDVLEELWFYRPSIEELVRMNWQAFDHVEDEFEAHHQAANHATARYFALYLQESGRLDEVFRAFRARRVEDASTDPAADAVALLERVLGQSLAEVDQRFASWFGAMGGEGKK